MNVIFLIYILLKQKKLKFMYLIIINYYIKSINSILISILFIFQLHILKSGGGLNTHTMIRSILKKVIVDPF